MRDPTEASYLILQFNDANMKRNDKIALCALISVGAIIAWFLSRPQTPSRELKPEQSAATHVQREDDPAPVIVKTKKMYPHADYTGSVVKLKLPSDENGMQPESVFIQNTVSNKGASYSVEGAHILEIAMAEKQDGFRILGKNVKYRIEVGDMHSTFVIPPDSVDVALITPDWEHKKREPVSKTGTEKKVIRISGCESYAGMNLLIANGSNIDGAEIPEKGSVNIAFRFDTLRQIVIYDQKAGMSSAVFYSTFDEVDLNSNAPNDFNLTQFSNLINGKVQTYQVVVNGKIPRGEVHFYANEVDMLPVLVISTKMLKSANLDVPKIVNYVSYPKERDKKEIRKGANFDSFEIVAP